MHKPEPRYSAARELSPRVLADPSDAHSRNDAANPDVLNVLNDMQFAQALDQNL